MIRNMKDLVIISATMFCLVGCTSGQKTTDEASIDHPQQRTVASHGSCDDTIKLSDDANLGTRTYRIKKAFSAISDKFYHFSVQPAAIALQTTHSIEIVNSLGGKLLTVPFNLFWSWFGLAVGQPVPLDVVYFAVLDADYTLENSSKKNRSTFVVLDVADEKLGAGGGYHTAIIYPDRDNVPRQQTYTYCVK
jgi:hypothetical protein